MAFPKAPQVLTMNTRLSLVRRALPGSAFLLPATLTGVLSATARLPAATYYLCGNGQMVRDVIDGLVAAGVDRAQQIRTDW